MAISKLILNGEVQMDVTSNTNAANNMLNGVIGTKNDGTSVTGNIASKSSDDLTVSGATVTAPAGYYANAASKAVATTTHPNPTAAIVSSTGVVTATHTQTTGYVTSGTTTGTLNLTTQGATTYNTSTADQTIASNRWLTGTQTIKSVTTTNLTAANIAEGVTVQVGDANNASRITQITGTYAPTTSSLTVTPTETSQTFNATGVYGYKPVTINAISSTYVGTGVSQRSAADITKSSNEITAPMGYYSQSATYTVPTYSHTSPSIGFTSSTGIIEATHTAKDVMQNWGMLTGYTTTSSEYALTTQAGQTFYPSTTDQTILRYRWLTGSQIIASVTTSNLTAANIAEGVVVKVGDSANASRITQITGTHSSGDGFTADQIATRTISGDISGNATSIGSYAFYQCTSLTTASFPSCTSIGSYAFYFCTSLTTASFPSCTSIGSSAFYGCYSLTTASFPLCKTIGSYAFYYCSNLTTASFTSCTSISNYAFYWCSNLTTASFPSCTSIGSYAFPNCYSLTTANFPLCKTIGASAFQNCYSLTTANFPSCTTIGAYAFQNCSSLTTVSFPSCAVIGGSAFYWCYSLTTASFPLCTAITGYAFRGCYNLLSLYLLGSTVPTLGTSAFASTPIGGYTTSTGGVYGSIFVPASLYDSYLTATNWSLYSERIVSV